MELYFAYGSNLSVEQMASRCPDSRIADVAQLFCYRLSFSSYSNRWNGAVATVLPASNACVWGLLYKLSRQDLAKLDEIEGYRYRREEIELKLRDGATQKAWTYIMNKHDAFSPPSRLYLSHLQIGAQLFNFPLWYQTMLKTVPYRELVMARQSDGLIAS